MDLIATWSEWCRKDIRFKDPHPVHFRDAIIRLMILHHGPRDIAEIDRILSELEALQHKARYVWDNQFYREQIESYEILKRHLQSTTR
jgi:hypothetical protein